MRYLSVCSGIEAATSAWHPLGWEAAAFAEIDPFPSAVLHYHYQSGRPIHMPDPDTAKTSDEARSRAAAIKGVAYLPEQSTEPKNYGDFTAITEQEIEEIGPIDILVGGTPCQSFSIAGLRQGMDDDRGNLALEFIRLADRVRPKWILWENVPGVLSSNGGRDFGSFLAALGELGYGFAYRVLDAQFFGVAQRRRRVFVVGHLGDWRCAAAVLFEREGLSRHSAPRRQAGESIADNVAIGVDEECNPRIEQFGALMRGGQGGTRQSVAVFGGGKTSEMKPNQLTAIAVNARQDPISGNITGPLDTDGGTHAVYGGGKTSGPRDVAATLVAHGTKQDFDVENFVTTQYGNIAGTLSARHDSSPCADRGQSVLAFSGRNRGDDGRGYGRGPSASIEIAGTIDTVKPDRIVTPAMDVRRLLPVECERLQGFPDDHTKIPYRGKPADLCPDGPRYKSIGNSKSVPVVAWLGKRIGQVNNLIAARKAVA